MDEGLVLFGVGRRAGPFDQQGKGARLVVLGEGVGTALRALTFLRATRIVANGSRAVEYTT